MFYRAWPSRPCPVLRGGAGGTPAALGIVTPWGQDPRSGAWFWEVSGKRKRSRLPPEYSPTHTTVWGTPIRSNPMPRSKTARSRPKNASTSSSSSTVCHTAPTMRPPLARALSGQAVLFLLAGHKCTDWPSRASLVRDCHASLAMTNNQSPAFLCM